MGDALSVGLLEHSAERGHIRQLSQAQESFHQGIVLIVATLAQFPITEKQVQDQLQEEGWPGEHLRYRLMGKATCQTDL